MLRFESSTNDLGMKKKARQKINGSFGPKRRRRLGDKKRGVRVERLTFLELSIN